MASVAMADLKGFMVSCGYSGDVAMADLKGSMVTAVMATVTW